jgi:26S proteasome regulatory subunit N3
MAQDSMQTDEAPAPQQKKKDSPEALAEPSPLELLKNVVTVLDTAVKLKETRLMSGRLMRLTAILRKHLSPEVLLTYVSSCLPSGTTAQADLTASINQVGLSTGKGSCAQRQPGSS